jgi:hypothetical protein
MGHTISRCAVREQNNSRRRSEPSQVAPVAQQQVAQAQAPVQVKKSNNKYAAFEEDDEEEVLHVQEQAQVDAPLAKQEQAPLSDTEFPSLLRTSSVAAPMKHVSYAAAFVSTAAPQKWQSRSDARRVVEPSYEDDEYEEEEVDGAEAILSRFRHEETQELYNDNPLLNRDYAYEDW